MKFEEKYNEIIEEASAANASEVLNELHDLLMNTDILNKLDDINMKTLKTITSAAGQLLKTLKGVK